MFVKLLNYSRDVCLIQVSKQHQTCCRADNFTHMRNICVCSAVKSQQWKSGRLTWRIDLQIANSECKLRVTLGSEKKWHSMTPPAPTFRSLWWRRAQGMWFRTESQACLFFRQREKKHVKKMLIEPRPPLSGTKAFFFFFNPSIELCSYHIWHRSQIRVELCLSYGSCAAEKKKKKIFFT